MGQREAIKEPQPDRYGYLPTEGLVLSRRPGQRISCGDGLCVFEVVSIRGNRVQVRVQALRAMRIVRCELDQPAAEVAS